MSAKVTTNAVPTIEVFECPPTVTGSSKTQYALKRDAFLSSTSIKERKKVKEQPYLLIGFDTEYQTPTELLDQQDVKDGIAKNTVLSYQFSCLMSTGETWECIACPEDDKRLSFGECLVFALGYAVKNEIVAQLPEQVFLVSHFTRADLPAFNDFQQIHRRLNAVQNTFVTARTPLIVRIDFDDPVFLKVHLRDTMLVTPGGAGSKSLDTVGQLVGIEKVKLSSDPEEDASLKGQMRLLRDTNWDLFKEYALNDARICSAYLAKLIDRVEAVTGKRKVPITLASIGTDLLLKSWKETDQSHYQILGQERVVEQVWSRKLNRSVRQQLDVPIEVCHWRESFVTETYHGGRNEQMWFGPGYEADWYDYDLTSAYPTAMSLIGLPDWNEMFQCSDINQFTALTLGFACVDFKFPDHVRYPCLPVRSNNGLIFPLQGTSYCAAPEIAVAESLGAKLRIKEGWIVPTDRSNLVFSTFIKHALDQRRSHRKGSLEALFWKEIANSTYGKTAQGLRKKRVFDLRDHKIRQQQPSRITNCFYASYTTSFVRGVLGEIMNAIPSNRMVFSCTTDGFITDADRDDMALATAGPLCQFYRDARKALTGEPELLEIKHQVRVPLGWTTRGQATLVPGNRGGATSSNFILAKGGISVPYHLLGAGDDNDYIVNLFMRRYPGQIVRIEPFTGVRDMVKWDADLVRKKVDKRLNMEFDWKRKPFAVGMHPTYNHVAFSTVSWRSIEDFVKVRDQWEAFNRPDRTCIKTLADFEQFASYANSRLAIEAVSVKSGNVRKSNPDEALLRNNLCSAWRQSKAGLTWERGKAAVFAETLTSAGLPTKRTHVEYGNDRLFIPKSCPPTPRCRAIVETLKSTFPTLDETELFIPSEHLTSVAARSPEECQFLSKVVRSPVPESGTKRLLRRSSATLSD